MKQLGGGVLEWTTPSGKVYISRPEPHGVIFRPSDELYWSDGEYRSDEQSRSGDFPSRMGRAGQVEDAPRTRPAGSEPPPF